MKPFIIYHEHPEWFKPLLKELSEREIPFIQIDPRSYHFDLEENKPECSLFLNRMSPSAYLRNAGQGIFFTLDYLKHLETLGITVINGYRAYSYEISKARQLILMQSLGIKYPKSKVINHPNQIIAASNSLRFPILVKPNIGGSGAGITKFSSVQEIESAIKENNIDLGMDNTALVQEFIPARGGYITRIETLGGKFLYGIRVYTTGNIFNLCPADICQTDNESEMLQNSCVLEAPKNGLRIESYTPSEDIIENIETIVKNAGIDVGGIEYIIDDRDGEVLYYDVNTLSNFVADAENVIGFNPHKNLVDYLEKKAGVIKVNQPAEIYN